MNNVPLIVGGGDYPRKKVRKSRGINKPGNIKKMPRQPGKMPYLIKAWQDRNISNQGTKLNP